MDITRLKSQLLEQQKALRELEETGKNASQIVVLDQTSVGRVSRMDAMQGQAMAKATNQRRAIELQKIESALKRIDADKYGYCLSCDEEIAEARLTLDPATTLCIQCASKKEQG